MVSFSQFWHNQALWNNAMRLMYIIHTLYKIKLDFVDLLRPSNNYKEKQRGYFI